MKFKVSMREITREALVFKAGNEWLNSLFTYRKPIAYSVGEYGWNCDYYPIDADCGVFLSIGNRPCGYDIKDKWILDALEQEAAKALHLDKRVDKINRINALIDLLYVYLIDYHIWLTSKDKAEKAEYAACVEADLISIANETGYKLGR